MPIQHAEFGPSQLVVIIRSERKYRTEGYLVQPLANGTRDGYGMPTWVAESQVKILENLDDWVYLLSVNQYRRKTHSPTTT